MLFFPPLCYIPPDWRVVDQSGVGAQQCNSRTPLSNGQLRPPAHPLDSFVSECSTDGSTPALGPKSIVGCGRSRTIMYPGAVKNRQHPMPDLQLTFVSIRCARTSLAVHVSIGTLCKINPKGILEIEPPASGEKMLTSIASGLRHFWQDPRITGTENSAHWLFSVPVILAACRRE